MAEATMNPTVGTRLDRQLIERIDMVARMLGRSRSDWMREALEATVSAQEQRITNLALRHTEPLHDDSGGVNSDLTAYDVLSPTQRAVWELMISHPDGVCRRDFANHDIWEVSNRVAEIEAKLGAQIARERCWKHLHRHRVVLYRI